MKLVKFGFPLLSLIFSSFAVQADAGHGKVLQDKSCTKCHDSSVYTRPDRRINNLAALQQQVSQCKKPAGAEWDKEATSDVVDYLNTEFYNFK